MSSETADYEPIDIAIGGVERLYQSITGQQAPPVKEPHSAMPPEKAPEQHLEEQMDRLMESMSRLLTPAPSRPWAPAISVSEGTDDLRIWVDLPGVPRDVVKVRLVQPNLLEVSGRRPDPAAKSSEKPRNLLHREQPQGAFLRWIPLPSSTSEERIAARMADGVLELRIPRADTGSEAGRSIPVH
jgi:HSP20 family protein